MAGTGEIGARIFRSHRPAKPSRVRSRRSTPDCANSSHDTLRPRVHDATALSREYVHPFPVSSCDQIPVMPTCRCNRSRSETASPVRTTSDQREVTPQFLKRLLYETPLARGRTGLRPQFRFGDVEADDRAPGCNRSNQRRVVDHPQITLEPDHLNHSVSLNSARGSQGCGGTDVRDDFPGIAAPYALPMKPSDALSEPSSLPRNVVVVGAGPAGLAGASRLARAGVEVVVAEKSRGIGGRVATRRTPDGITFDHGAQYVTARGASFSAFLATASSTGTASEWNPVTDPSRVRVASGSAELAASGQPTAWFVGTPGMSSLFRSLASGMTIRTGVTVTRVDLTGNAVWLEAIEADHSSNRIGPFEAAIIAIPAPQAIAVAGHLPDVAGTLSGVLVSPCWALMVAFTGELLLPADVFRRPDGPIAWVARDTSKPGRSPDVTTLVIHASADWSRDHLEDEPDTVASCLLDALRASVGATLPVPVHAVAHRWRYSQTTVPLNAPFAEAAEGRVLIGGDWTTGARVEAAWDSGEAMANHLLGG